MGNGEKLERWGDIVLRRPDPQVMWPIPNEVDYGKILTDITTEVTEVEDNGT